jgi:hypothetical protein
MSLFPQQFLLKKQIQVRSQDHFRKVWALLTGLDIYGMTTTGNVIVSPASLFKNKNKLKLDPKIILEKVGHY